MKFKYTLTLGLVALGFASGASAEDIKINVPTAAQPAAAAAVAPAAPAAPQYGETEVLQALGWLAGRQMNLDTFGFTEAQMEQVVSGIRLAAGNQELPYAKEKIGPLIQEYVQRKQAEFMGKLKVKNDAEAASYFGKLAADKNVVVLPSGLAYEVLKPGTGATPKPSDVVKVHYTGKLLDGSVFDSSVERGEPVEFTLDQVIPGWTEGLQHISVGGKIRLHIPAKLGYGDQGSGRIPPGATLSFEVELLEVKAPAPAAAPAAPAAPAAEVAPAPAAAK